MTFGFWGVMNETKRLWEYKDDFFGIFVKFSCQDLKSHLKEKGPSSWEDNPLTIRSKWLKTLSYTTFMHDQYVTHHAKRGPKEIAKPIDRRQPAQSSKFRYRQIFCVLSEINK